MVVNLMHDSKNDMTDFRDIPPYTLNIYVL
jgi:hypothetical protein